MPPAALPSPAGFLEPELPWVRPFVPRPAFMFGANHFFSVPHTEGRALTFERQLCVIGHRRASLGIPPHQTSGFALCVFTAQ